MAQRLRGALTFANVTSVLALVFAMGGGAYAITSIPGADGLIHGCYWKTTGNLRVIAAGKKCRRSERAITWNQKGAAGLRGQQGALGLPGVQGQPGAQGQPGSAKAYTFVNRFSPTTLDPSRTKGFTALTNPAGGDYCLTPPAGVDPTHDPAVASPEYTNSLPSNPVVYWDSTQFPCPLGTYHIATTTSSGPHSAQISFTVIVP